MTPVVYVSGTGRSGTNIVKEILGKHSQIATLPFEHRFTIDPHGLVDYYRNMENWSPYMADSKLKELAAFLRKLANRDVRLFDESQQLQAEGKTAHPYVGWELEKWIPGYTQFVEELLANLTVFTYEAAYPGSEAGVAENTMWYSSPDIEKSRIALSVFLEKCHGAITHHQSKQIFLEDNTWSILFADVLNRLSPQGKLVHMIRDPRDVIASMQKQKWTPSTLQNVITYYKDIIEKWQAVRKKLPYSFFLEVRLEDLISETKHTIEDLCEFVGVAAEQTMFEIELTNANVGRYKEQFSTAEVTLIETQLTDFLQQYHYS